MLAHLIQISPIIAGIGMTVILIYLIGNLVRREKLDEKKQDRIALDFHPKVLTRMSNE